jgi:hypothetical protein
LRSHLGLTGVDRMRSASELEPDEAMRLAYDELHALRRERTKR